LANLDLDYLAEALSGAAIGGRIRFREELGSTNDEALTLGADGFPHGMVVIADRQTAGRGRRGAVWESPAGKNLYLSVLLRPTTDVRLWPRITTLVALAVSRALEATADVRAQIKWPNDIYVDDRKIAGILTETRVSGDEEDRFIVAGTGINVFSESEDFHEELRPIATSLRLADSKFTATREDVLIAYLRNLQSLISQIDDHPFSEVLAEVTRRSWLIGRQVEWSTAAGPDKSGHALSLDEMGGLVVQLPNGDRRVLNSVERIRRSQS